MEFKAYPGFGNHAALNVFTPSGEPVNFVQGVVKLLNTKHAAQIGGFTFELFPIDGFGEPITVYTLNEFMPHLQALAPLACKVDSHPADPVYIPTASEWRMLQSRLQAIEKLLHVPQDK